MKKINIIMWPKKVLSTKTDLVEFPLSKDMKIHIDSMIEYIDKSQEDNFTGRSGVGLSANQIGLNARMFYVNVPLEDDDSYREFLINPEIIGESQGYAALEQGEGCLSVDESDKNIDGLVHRKHKVVMRGYSYFQKKEVTINKSGYTSIVLQHEMDHLNGKIFPESIDHKNKWIKKENEILL